MATAVVNIYQIYTFYRVTPYTYKKVTLQFLNYWCQINFIMMVSLVKIHSKRAWKNCTIKLTIQIDLMWTHYTFPFLTNIIFFIFNSFFAKIYYSKHDVCHLKIAYLQKKLEAWACSKKEWSRETQS